MTTPTSDPSFAFGSGHMVRLRLLGDPVLIADGKARALERRAAGLLALVALEPGVTRARAAALLWPDSDNARQALRQQIARFRKNYGADLVRGEEALFIADRVVADLLAETAPEASGDLLGNLSFGDCADFAEWLDQQRQRRRGRASAEIGRQLAEAEAQGDLDRAARLAEQLLLADNDSEAHHRTLMRLHYLRGDIAQAQAVYDRLVRQLVQRFGARPSAETEQLARALRSALAAPRTVSPTPRPVPVTVLRPPRMIGRQRELAALDDAWQGGRAALLVGEPGLGKSRLLAEFAAGRRVLMVQGRPGDAGVPYATLSRLLRAVFERTRIELPAPRRSELARLLPELAPSVPLPADGQRLLLQGAVEAVLGQARADGSATDGVIVDDLHFADDASVEMLQALICGSAGAETLAGLRWALAQRPGEGSAAAAALRETQEEAQALAVIELAPLTESEMAELIDSLGLPELDSAQLAPQLTKHTGGNPLYALETLKQGLASGLLRQGRLPTPVNVGALIERRLKQLSERALALARVAAIAGVDFGIGLAEHVMGVRAVELADAWGELEAAQVLREQAFAHDLVHDAVLRSVPEAIARHLHAQLAQWLVEHNGESARIASHWEAAHENQHAADAWTEAARSADARLRYRESQACFEHAARLYESLGDRQSHFLALQGAVDQASLLDGDPRAYATLCDRLIAAAPSDRQRVQAMVYRLRALEMVGDGEAMLRGADQVIALAQACGEKRTEAIGRSGRATAIAALGRLDEAAALYEEVAALGLQIGDPEIEGFGHSSRAVMLTRLGRHVEALAQFERAAVLYTGNENHLRLAMVEQQRAVILVSRGHAVAGLVAAERALSLAQRVEVSLDVDAHCHLARAMALRALGRYGEALTVLETAQTKLAAARIWVLARLQLEQAHLFLDLGRPDRARFLLARTRDDALLPVGERSRLVGLELLLNAAGAGPVGTADTASALAVANDKTVEPRRRCELLRALAHCAHGAERQARLEQALRLATEADLPHEHCTARALLASDLARAGQAGAAAELMRMATADADIVPAGYPPAVLECAVAVWKAAGDDERARQALHRALDWIDAAGRGLPDELRASFVERNPVNRRLLEQGRRTPALRA
ncbi:MAG: AAA family ATPase [Burkholderiaceae bacterium]|nr:AAA family ATPase [Burkholderiaceae bacterium]